MRIAISGYGGTGKTTLALALKDKLSSLGINAKVITITFRDLARDKGVSLEEIQRMAEKDPKFDLELDKKIREEFSSSENCISASWISIWTLKDIADLKVFLFAPERERVKRISERDGIEFEAALEKERKRLEENRERYMKLYNIDILKPEEVADICINTSSFSVGEEVELILNTARIKGLIP